MKKRYVESFCHQDMSNAIYDCKNRVNVVYVQKECWQRKRVELISQCAYDNIVYHTFRYVFGGERGGIMKLNKISCPDCGASISLSIEGQSYVFCPYCGSHFAIDDGNRTITRNYNTNYNSDISYHSTYTDDAAVEREKRIDRENERDHKLLVLMIMVMCALIFVPMFIFWIDEHKAEQRKKDAIEAGMIVVGQSSSDMEERDYKVVVEQLKSAGFTDITTVDLDDSGWFTKKKGTVESVTISGDSSFSAGDCFYPTAKIVVSYH